MWMPWNIVKTYHIFHSEYLLFLRLQFPLVMPFEKSHLDVVGINVSDKVYCGSFIRICGKGVVKADWYSVNAGLTKSHDRKNSNRMILPNDYTLSSSAMKYATKNECKYFYNMMRVALFGLNNMEFKQNLVS